MGNRPDLDRWRVRRDACRESMHPRFLAAWRRRFAWTCHTGVIRPVPRALTSPLAGLVVGLLIAAGFAVCRRHFRRAASSLLAIAAIPVCTLIVANLPLFDPWLWYAIANSSRFETLVASGPPSNGPKYAVVEIRDVSTGLAGLGLNHFIGIVYDKSDAVGLEPSERPPIWRTRTMWPQSDIQRPSQGQAFVWPFLPRRRL